MKLARQTYWVEIDGHEDAVTMGVKANGQWWARSESSGRFVSMKRMRVIGPVCESHDEYVARSMREIAIAEGRQFLLALAGC